jgi:hypothetical protein
MHAIQFNVYSRKWELWINLHDINMNSWTVADYNLFNFVSASKLDILSFVKVGNCLDFIGHKMFDKTKYVKCVMEKRTYGHYMIIWTL